MELKDFSKWAKDTGDNVSRNADKLVRKCALAIDGAVVLATPVDTGRARSNWQVTVDTPAAGTIPPYAPGEGGSTVGPNSRAAIEQGKQAVAQYNGDTPTASINITNNLAYIGRLNNGYSGQAPAGFVEKAIMVGRDAIQNAALTTQVSERLP